MIVTKLESVTKTKFKIYIDEQFAFILYKGELSRYHIKEDHEISEETIHSIKKDVLQKRAKLRAMHLLNAMARTEHDLRQKLKLNGYPEDVIEHAVTYVKSFGYINDESYIYQFILSRKDKKSRREIQFLLSQKGVSQELVEQVMEEIYAEHSDVEAIRELAEKRHWIGEELDEKQKQKAYAYLLRKGFRYEDIRHVIQV